MSVGRLRARFCGRQLAPSNSIVWPLNSTARLRVVSKTARNGWALVLALIVQLNTSTRHVDEQPSPDNPLGSRSSHCSPLSASTTPLPQVSLERQSEEQPSPATTLPSSQASAASRIPSPQRCGWQLVRHAAFASSLLADPASQPSPFWASAMPSPQRGMRHEV